MGISSLIKLWHLQTQTSNTLENQSRISDPINQVSITYSVTCDVNPYLIGYGLPKSNVVTYIITKKQSFY